jgi:hypothetical protein
MDEPIRPRRPDESGTCPWCSVTEQEVTGKCSTCGRTQADTVSEQEEVACQS